MKKVISITLSLLMLAAVCIPVSAKGETPVPTACSMEKEENALTYSYDSAGKTMTVKHADGYVAWDAIDCGAGFFFPTGSIQDQNLKAILLSTSDSGLPFAVQMLSPAFQSGKIQQIFIPMDKDSEGISSYTVRFTRDSAGHVVKAEEKNAEGAWFERDTIAYSGDRISSIRIDYSEAGNTADYYYQLTPGYDSKGNLISCEIRQNSFGQENPTLIHVTCKTNSKGALTEYTLSDSINNPVFVQYSGSKISFLKPKSADAKDHSQYVLSIWYNADGTVKTFLQGGQNYYEYKYTAHIDI